ncbi:hypothetical protein A2480_01955 [Candidatus Uhrbacteria bacterium RIFOXYC2_FULL_47_19]|uniref:Uncharacterized protein n=1 Tax=Candidatus Uhrbacteria bacterium RIFOXYC2_FULL_47_19 TaxID=1802424 RepID=A0A1F7WGG0_9BACT|nr:MAG: hypothetical protein A2480_01955 [Candidatus Uhrbacteria bacterium RIFOXYC2_FULL_47_19]HCC22436.1 hypothetical protein [Candidatus Uhrbacteria bacterium]
MPENDLNEDSIIAPTNGPSKGIIFWQSLICLLVMMCAAGVMVTASKSGVSLIGTSVSSQYSNWKILTTLVGVMALVFLTMNSVRSTKLLGTVMFLAIIFGLTFGVNVLFGPAIGTVVFCLAVVVYYSNPWVMLYDLVLCLGLAGICAAIGPAFQSWVLLLVLGLVAIYDVMIIYLSGRSVLFSHQLPPRRSFIYFFFPFYWSNFLVRVRKANRNVNDFGFRGIGELLLPTMFAASVMWHYGLAAAGSVMLGATLFLVLTHITTSWPRLTSILPPLALGSVIGYLTFFLII